VLAACAISAGYQKVFCNAWVSLPLKLLHHDEYYNHKVYWDQCVLIYLHKIWNKSWTMIAGHNANLLYPIFNPGLVSENRLEKILNKVMKDKTLALMLVTLFFLFHASKFANTLPSSHFPPPPSLFYSLHSHYLSLPIITMSCNPHYQLCRKTRGRPKKLQASCCKAR
jgi:hypothetical protein